MRLLLNNSEKNVSASHAVLTRVSCRSCRICSDSSSCQKKKYNLTEKRKSLYLKMFESQTLKTVMYLRHAVYDMHLEHASMACIYDMHLWHAVYGMHSMTCIYSMHLWHAYMTCNLWHTILTCNLWHASMACSLLHAIYGTKSLTCNLRHTIYDMQSTTCIYDMHLQHATYDMPQIACHRCMPPLLCYL